MRMARKAMKQDFDFGETIFVPDEWACEVSQRPEVGYRPKYLMKCSRGDDPKPLVGIK
jgi:hypothetical protein